METFYYLNAKDLVECFRIMKCMTKQEYDDLFNSDHYYFKLAAVHAFDCTSFMCNLENQKVELLLDYVFDKMKANKQEKKNEAITF